MEKSNVINIKRIVGEDAPEEIKRLRYSKVKNSDKMNFYVYNSN